MGYNYLIYFTIQGVAEMTTAVVKSRSPDNALYALSQALSKHGANDIRLVSMVSVSEDYIFENQEIIQMFI